MIRRVILGALALTVGQGTLHAEPAPSPPCADAVTDPVVTPIRDARLDTQRSACMRQTLSAGLGAHALIDTPGFHGVLGSALVLGGSVIVAKAHELSAELSLVSYEFVQNAVNKVTSLGVGPLVLGGAAGTSIGERGTAAVVLRVEVPYTRDDLDTTRTSAQLAGVVSGMLSRHVVLHTRLASIGSVATSTGGTTKQLAFVAGADLAWHVGAPVALDLGADVMGGWQAGFDHLLLRTGVHWRPRERTWRLRIGIGIPVAGAERTTGVLDAAFVVDR